MPLRPPKGFIPESDVRVSQIGHPAPPWLINYADLMTELVCFFIILYALSAALNKELRLAASQIQKVIADEGLKGEVKIDREGLKVSLEEQGKMAFFDSGKADLTSDMVQILDKMAPKLRELTSKHELIVEGHTDNIPISDDYFASNWDLSTARATTVVEYLSKDRGFPPERLAAIGYGEYRPIAPNDSVENRARNRRVVFFVRALPPSPGPAQGPPKP